MNAITLLMRDHRDVEDLFDRLSSTDDPSVRGDLFGKLALALTVHTVIEEQHFYPGVRERDTEGLLRGFFKDHQEVRRLVAELLDLDTDDEAFSTRLSALEEAVERHVSQEEQELFPRVQRMIRGDTLEAIGDEMRATRDSMAEADPREIVDAESVQFESLS